MTLETFTYVFEVLYEDGKTSYVRVASGEDAKDMAWRLAVLRTGGLRKVKSISFICIEV